MPQAKSRPEPPPVPPLAEQLSALPDAAQARWRELLASGRACAWLASSVPQCPQCGHGVAVVRWQGYELSCQRRLKLPQQKEPHYRPCGWRLKLGP
jgi:hypothetical protein